MARNEQEKELVEKIQQFFSHQIETNGSLNDAAKESLTVATECIEQAYGIQKKPASPELAEIFQTNRRPQDPIHLLTNMYNTIFTQSGGLMGSAGAGSEPGVEARQQQQQQQHPQEQHENRTNDDSRSNGPPKQRKLATDAEKIAAESFKNQGNDCMKQDKCKEAYDYYTQAIEIDGNNAIYYSNRAAASLKLGNHQAAVRDCQEAIEIDPNYSKAYGRMGLAFASLENHLEAKKAYLKAVELDPTNESYRNNLNIAEAKLAEQQSGTGQADSNSSGVGANVMGMLRSMMSNPQVMSMAMQSLQDPRIQGMFRMGGSGAGAESQGTREEAQQQSAPNPSVGQQTGNPQPGSGPQATTDQPTPPGQQAPSFNPTDLLNLTSRIAGNANIDLVGAGQQLLSSIQENNPQLVDNMRRMMNQAFMNQNNANGGSGGNREDENPPPGFS